jgi:hypothetical protein
MDLANTLAYCDMAKITFVKSLKVLALSEIISLKFQNSKTLSVTYALV